MQVRHFLLASWFDIPAGEHGDNFGRLKKTLAEGGVNARGWRLYLDFGDALFEALGLPWIHPDHPFTSAPNAVAFLRLLAACESDVPPPFRLIASMKDWGIPKNRLETIPPHFLRAAWKSSVLAGFEVKAKPDAEARFITDDVIPVARWLFAESDGIPNEDRLKAGWEAIATQYREWQRRNIRQESNWPSFLDTVKSCGYQFSALASDAALEAEGEAMCHCIGDYGDRCREEMLRAYAVSERRTGLRVATVTVCENELGKWEIEEIKGPQNATVSSQVIEAALAIVASLEEAYELFPAIRREMDVARSQVAAPPRRHMTEVDFDETPF